VQKTVKICGLARRNRVAAMALLICFAASQAAAGPASLRELREAFQSPPDDARIMMRWWWFGPAVTHRELSREMESMKAGGIGGFEVQPVYAVAFDDQERGIRNLPFMSEEFLDALRFTAQRAEQLGLRFDLTLGSGWPYGGPHIPITHASGALRHDRVKLAAGSRRITLPDTRAGETILAAFAVRIANGQPDAASIRELNDYRDGALWAPAGLDESYEVWFFVSSRSGKLVERAAVRADGFVHDHYARNALETHLREVGYPLLRAVAPHLPYAIFCDSLEVDESDWTPKFLDEFQKRRGYDLRPHLPALVADVGPQTRAIRHDWGKTLTELVETEFLAPLAEWARAQGTKLRAQVYGVPPAVVSSNAYADLPEGEGGAWKTLTASRWASSASHHYGRQVASSEIWTWLNSPVFRATPLDMKAEANQHFLQGINQLVGHGWPYTAEGVEYPGWHFYAAGVYNEKNPWWIVMPEVSRYLQRLSFVLRQGRPSNDVALYLPNSDTWADTTPGHAILIRTMGRRVGEDLIGGILEAGYVPDFFDDGVLEQLGRVDNGALRLGDNRYPMVVLPGLETIPLDTLRKLEEFANAGGKLVATGRLPSMAPGFLAGEAAHQEVRAIVGRLFQSPSAPARLVDDPKRLGAMLNSAFTADVSFAPAAPAVGFVHRSVEFAEIYFLANTANTAMSGTASFRAGGAELAAEWWDPMSGETTPAEIAGRGGEVVKVALALNAYASRVLVFSRDAAPFVRSPAAPFVPPPATPPVSGTIDISSGWSVKFGQDSQPVAMERLTSWTDDERTRYFSGVAVYEREVTVPDRLLREGVPVRLDFGEGTLVSSGTTTFAGMRALLEGPVREAAVVYVNGKRAGSVWSPPYAVEVAALLRPGVNRIRIEVGNLALNYKVGRPLPEYRLLNQLYTERFTDQDMKNVKPQPAGLLGPVRLVAGAHE
jgi:hypothetical protein